MCKANGLEMVAHPRQFTQSIVSDRPVRQNLEDGEEGIEAQLIDITSGVSSEECGHEHIGRGIVYCTFSAVVRRSGCSRSGYEAMVRIDKTIVCSLQTSGHDIAILQEAVIHFRTEIFLYRSNALEGRSEGHLGDIITTREGLLQIVI